MIAYLLVLFAGTLFGFFVACLLAGRAQSERDHYDALARDQRMHERFKRHAHTNREAV